MSYKTRTPQRTEASGGQLSNPLPGMGKLGIGKHRVTVLAVTPGPNTTSIILETLAREAHAEAVPWVPDWVLVGMPVDAKIGFTHGAIVCRNVDQYQGQDALSLTPYTAWLPSIDAVYAALPKDIPLASTRLMELSHADYGTHRFDQVPSDVVEASPTPATDAGSDRPDTDPTVPST